MEPEKTVTAHQIVLRLADGTYLLSFRVPQCVEYESIDCAWRGRPVEEFHLPDDTLKALFPGSELVKLSLHTVYYPEVPRC